MAVYERAYRPYAGRLTAEKSRFLVLPRYAFREVFGKRLFVAFFSLSLVLPVGIALYIYLTHNLEFIKTFAGANAAALASGSLFPPMDGARFLAVFMIPQGWMAFFMVFVVGPELITADLRNNALPLYFSRPFARWEYILGKTSTLIVLTSLITWIPGLLLFLLQAYFEGAAWLGENVRVGLGTVIGFWIYILLLCLLSLAVSAYVRMKQFARLALFAIFLVGAAFGNVLNLLLGTRWGSLLNLGQMIAVIWADLMGVRFWVDVPVAAAWLSLLVVCGICLILLARKVRAYEVVR